MSGVASAGAPAQVVATVLSPYNRADGDQQPSFDEIAEQMLPTECNAVTGKRLLDHRWVRVVQQPRLWKLGWPDRLGKPLGPGHVRPLTLVDVQQVVANKRCRVSAAVKFKPLGKARRGKGPNRFSKQHRRIPFWPISGARNDGQVPTARVKFRAPLVDPELNLHPRRSLQLIQQGHDPRSGHRRLHGKHQNILWPPNVGQRSLDRGERPVDGIGQRLTVLGEGERSPGAFDHVKTELLGQGRHMP